MSILGTAGTHVNCTLVVEGKMVGPTVTKGVYCVALAVWVSEVTALVAKCRGIVGRVEVQAAVVVADSCIT